MLSTFGHRVATCWVLFENGQYKFKPTAPNMSQHIATGWPNASTMLRPTMLRYVALACCDLLARGLTTSLVQANLFCQKVYFWPFYKERGLP